jgi:hypothetical protein
MRSSPEINADNCSTCKPKLTCQSAAGAQPHIVLQTLLLPVYEVTAAVGWGTHRAECAHGRMLSKGASCADGRRQP